MEDEFGNEIEEELDVGSWDGKSRPDESQFENYDDFIEAQTSWKVDQKMKERPPTAPPPTQQPPPMPPPSPDMVALQSGTPADKAKALKKAEALENVKNFEIEAERSRAAGDMKTAAEHEEQARAWAKEYYDLGGYEFQEIHEEMVDVKLHEHMIQQGDEFSQGDLDAVNKKSGGQIFLIKVGDENYPVRVPPDRGSAADLFNEVTNYGEDISVDRQIRGLKAMGINIPPEAEEPEQSQEEFEKGRKQPEYTSPLEGVDWKDAPRPPKGSRPI